MFPFDYFILLHQLQEVSEKGNACVYSGITNFLSQTQERERKEEKGIEELEGIGM